MEQQFGLETYITQNGKNNGVYVSFPTTRKAIRRAFKKAHIPLNDWKVAALKTGSDAFSKAVFECRNLDELNLLGYWMSKFSEEEYYAFFDLCDAGCAEGQRIADFINLAANYHNIFCLKDIADEVALGRWCVEQMAKAKPEEADEIREEMAEHEEELGLEYAAFRHGHIYNNVFCGRKLEWQDVYFEDDPESIPEELRITTQPPDFLAGLPLAEEEP